MLNILRIAGLCGALLSFGMVSYAQTGEEEEAIFVIVEDMPEFEGGEEDLYTYLDSNLQYPVEALEKGIQGVVYVQFVVEKDGSVSAAKVIRGVEESLDQEALRVVKAMPKWKPGTQRGVAVRTSYTLPVRFVMERKPEKKEEQPSE